MILATVLLGPGSELTAPDAVRSVRYMVSGFVLIDGGGGAAAVKACFDALEGKHEIWTYTYKWRGDYGDARNFALSVAAQAGGKWALTLDSDERLYCGNLVEQLKEHDDCDVWVCRYRDHHGYHKPRAIRLDATESRGGPVRWNGPVHEELLGVKFQRCLDGYFDELEKDGGGYLARARRGVELMPEMIRKEPEKARWHRHLGECHLELGQRAQAHAAFEAMLDCAKTRTEKGWALYRVLELEIEGGGSPDARLSMAVSEYPDFVREFGWLTCYLAQLDRNWSKAYHWAKIVTQCEMPFSRLCGHQSKTALDGCRAAIEKIEQAAKEATVKGAEE